MRVIVQETFFFYNLITYLSFAFFLRKSFFRYKDDVYDRIWRYDDNYNNSGWYPFNEPVDIDPGSNGDIYKLPAQVLRTAARSQGVSYNLSFDYDSVFVDLDKPYEYYVYFHFAEIEQLPDGQKRIMDITLNSKPVLSPPLVLEYLKPVSLRFVAPGSVWFDIIATSQSDAPPLLNAFEIYQLITELDTPTHTQDGMFVSYINKVLHTLYGRGRYRSYVVIHDIVKNCGQM